MRAGMFSPRSLSINTSVEKGKASFQTLLENGACNKVQATYVTIRKAADSAQEKLLDGHGVFFGHKKETR